MGDGKRYSVAEVAKERNVSERAIYKQMKTHADKLEGHVVKFQGKQWLDQYAVDLLREASGNSAPVIVDNAEALKMAELRKENADLKQQMEEDKKVVFGFMTEMKTVLHRYNEESQLIAESKLYLEQRDNARKELDHLRKELESFNAKIKEEEAKSEKLKEERDSLQRELDALRQEQELANSRPWWKKIFG